ncbi:MAG: hypothetical protein ACJ8EU_17540 [Xanthobacteraceae bacterium]
MIVASHTRLVPALLIHCAVGAAALSFACAALAQSTPAPQLGVAPAAQPEAVPAAPQMPALSPDVQPPSPSPPGLFGTIGRWVDTSIGTVTSGLSSARDAVGGLGDQASEAAKGAADAASKVVRIPPTSIVIGRQHCIRTATGGPDCLTATEALCRSKGYSAGTSLHIQSEQKCPVWGWIASEKPVGKCGTETYVTSAMCR